MSRASASERASLLASSSTSIDVERGRDAPSSSSARVGVNTHDDARAPSPSTRTRSRACAVAAACVIACAIAAACAGDARARSRARLGLEIGRESDANATMEAGRETAAMGASKRVDVDDRAMRDEFLESQAASVTKAHEAKAKAFSTELAKEWRRFEERSRRTEDSDGDVLWMVRTAEYANVAMDKRGWWRPRTLTQRDKGDWMMSSVGARTDPAATAALSLQERLAHSLAHREAMIFNSCPSLVYLGAEYASHTWPSTVRQLGFAHGLRGTTTGTMDTLKSVRMNPKGPNFVLGASDGLSYEGLSAMLGTMSARDNGRLDESKSLFLIAGVRDPLKRAIEAYMQYGVARRGWEPTVESFENFVFGRYGRLAHVGNIQFKMLAPEELVKKALEREALQAKAPPIKDAEIMRVLNTYDLVVTPEHDLLARLLVKQMLYRVVSVRQILTPPDVGYARLDRFGFKRYDVEDKENVLPKPLLEYVNSRAFKVRFNRLNLLDQKLYDAANARLLRMWKEHHVVESYLAWRESVHDYVMPKLMNTQSLKAARELSQSSPRVAKVCPSGHEDDCSTVFEEHADEFLAEEKRRHASEQCMFENYGCFSRQLVNLGLLHYKRTRTAELASFFKQQETPESYGTAKAASCAGVAMVSEVRFCADNATLGDGVVGKAMTGLADSIYLLCARDACENLCVPKSWETKVRVVDGAKIDRCFGIQATENHFRRATLSHGAIVAHARQEKFRNVAVVEVDVNFVDPDPSNYPDYDAAKSVQSIAKHIDGNTAADSDDPFTIIRLGYRAWEFERGVVACPHGCGCRRGADGADDSYCVVTRAQCDLRGSHAYILSGDSFNLFLEPVLSKKRTQTKVIDFNVFQRFPQQLVLEPMLASQAGAFNDADFIGVDQQFHDARRFAQSCVVR